MQAMAERRPSGQYHERKDETSYLLSGRLWPDPLKSVRPV